MADTSLYGLVDDSNSAFQKGFLIGQKSIRSTRNDLRQYLANKIADNMDAFLGESNDV